MKTTKISFCIPTFNRDISVNKLVCEILKCSRRDIEVIVQDNNSTDLTLNYLSQIDDKRLKIYSNQKNIVIAPPMVTPGSIIILPIYP